uniref:Uncharacterized protein n=1 Tax=Chenopodium quinoa TaxID=63459 RepID=A0A803NAL7_CHEQI
MLLLLYYHCHLVIGGGGYSDGGDGRRYGCLLKMGDYDTLIELLKFQEQTLNVVPDFKNLVIQALLLKGRPSHIEDNNCLTSKMKSLKMLQMKMRVSSPLTKRKGFLGVRFKIAFNNLSESNIIGQGGLEKVYKGKLMDNKSGCETPYSLS